MDSVAKRESERKCFTRLKFFLRRPFSLVWHHTGGPKEQGTCSRSQSVASSPDPRQDHDCKSPAALARASDADEHCLRLVDKSCPKQGSSRPLYKEKKLYLPCPVGCRIASAGNGNPKKSTSSAKHVAAVCGCSRVPHCQ